MSVSPRDIALAYSDLMAHEHVAVNVPAPTVKCGGLHNHHT